MSQNPARSAARGLPEVPGDDPDRSTELVKDRNSGELIVTAISRCEPQERPEGLVLGLAPKGTDRPEGVESCEDGLGVAPLAPALGIDESVEFAGRDTRMSDRG